MDGLECSEISLSALERTTRIDSEFYSKENLQISDRMKSYHTEPITEKFYVSDGNHMSVSDDFREEGIPYYRGQDIYNTFIESASPICISEKYYYQQNMERSHLQKNDILLSIVGAIIGNTSMVYTNRKATCSCKLAIIRPKDKACRSFLVNVFLKSKYGQNQIQKFRRGTAQTGFLLEDMEQLLVPVFGEVFANHVQGVMDRLHELITKSQEVYQSAESLLLSTLNLDNFTFSTDNTSIKSFSQIDKNGRMDAEYYQPKYDEIEEKLSKFPQIKIKDLIKYPVCSGSTPKAGDSRYYTDENSGIPFVRAVDIVNSRIDTKNFIYVTPGIHNNLLKRTKLKKNDVLFSIAGTVGRCGIFDHDFEANINQAVAILRFSEEKIKRQYLVQYFNSSIGKLIIGKYSRQGLQTNLNLDEVSELSIPIIRHDIQEKIAKLISESFVLREQSELLLKAATRAVEIAIEQDESVAMAYLEEQTKGDV